VQNICEPQNPPGHRILGFDKVVFFGKRPAQTESARVLSSKPKPPISDLILRRGPLDVLDDDDLDIPFFRLQL
jgi:hypothetical protein